MNEKSSPILIMMIGLPCSGKTTWAKEYVTSHASQNFEIISSDDIIEKYAAQTNQTYDQAFKSHGKQATKEYWLKLRSAIHDKRNIIVDRTNLTKKRRNGILKSLPKCYTTYAKVFIVSDEILQKRNIRDGKIISDQVFNFMKESFDLPTEDEGFKEIWL